MPSDFLPVVILFVIGGGFVSGMMFITHALSRKISKVQLSAFECGIESVGNARAPLSFKYFLNAVLFVVFDIEIIFLYPWAVNFKELGIAGFVEMTIFLFLFIIGLFYIIRKGVLQGE